MDREPPLYESRRLPKNLWQRYGVYRDRIELVSWFGRFRIRFEDVVAIELSESLVRSMAKGQMGTLRGMKLDWADFIPHVEVRTSRGAIRSFRFTPDDPHEFIQAVLAARRRYPLFAEREARDGPQVDSIQLRV